MMMKLETFLKHISYGNNYKAVTPLTDEEIADKLARSGYAITSRKFRHATRIDRKYWKEFCEEKGHPIDADWYRRVLSEDTIVVPEAIRKLMPKSSDCDFGFRAVVID